MTDESTALDTGIDQADPAKSRESADVQQWAKRIEHVSKFDEPARKQYAKDRRYARGDSGFDVDANLVGTYIDILESFLYARDPDLDVLPAKAVEAPDIEAIRAAAELAVQNDPNMQQQLMAIGQQQMVEHQSLAAQGAVAGLPPPPAPTPETAMDALVQQQFDAMQSRYQQVQRDAKAFGETVEIVVSRLWKDAGLKRRGRRWVRSSLTVGLGVIKASWQERTAPSPETVQAINDLQDNIKRAAAQRQALEEESPGIFDRIKRGFLHTIGQDVEAKLATYERQLEALRGQAEQVVARGFVIDVVAPEDFRVAPGYTIADHCDAPWNAHRIPMLAEEAQAHFALDKDKMAKATKYTARKPETVQDKSAAVDTTIDARDADSFVLSQVEEGEGEFVMVWEAWDRDSNSVLTWIEGTTCWAKPAWQPTATTRFYPFFTCTTSEVDGQRHPQSLVTRGAKLVDEYNRIGSAEAEHRRRIKPKTAFNAGQMPPEQAKKLEGATTGEMVPLHLTNPNTPVKDVLHEIAYPALDPALYDRQRIINELERIFGIQEALSGAIDTPKTATEAEIQQSGFQARSSGRREVLEAALQELALYTAEVAHANLEPDAVAELAGPNAVWPAYEGPNSLSALLQIEIRAGSSGKPNTTAEREAMSAGLPLYQAAIDKIGMLRNSSPADVADCHENLVRIFADRVGDRIDIDGLMPKPGDGSMPGMADLMAPKPGESKPAKSEPQAA